MTIQHILDGLFITDKTQTHESRYTFRPDSDIKLLPAKTYVLTISGYTAYVYSIKDKLSNKFGDIAKDFICTIKLLDTGFTEINLHAIGIVNDDKVLFSFCAYDELAKTVYKQHIAAKSEDVNSKSYSVKNNQLDANDFVIQIMQKANDIKDKNELVDYLTSRVLSNSLTDRALIMMPAVKREDLTNNKQFYLDKRQTLSDEQNIVKIEITYVRGNVIFYKEEGSDTEDYFAADSVAVNLHMLEPAEYESNLNPKYFNVVSRMGMTKITYKHFNK